MRISIALALVALGLVGCSTTARLRTEDAAALTLPKTKAKDVQVFSTREAGKPYTVIGTVVADADAGTDAKASVNLLKQEAAGLGADAIVDLRLEIDQGYWQSGIKSTGLAVKFQ